MRPARFSRRSNLGRFLENEVDVSASQADNVYTGAANNIASLPLNGLCAHKEWAVFKINVGVRTFKVENRRNQLMLERQSRLDHAGDARSTVEVTDVGLN